MKRRGLLHAAGVSCLWALGAPVVAQARARRVAWIWAGGRESIIDACRAGLREHGFTEPGTLALEVRTVGLQAEGVGTLVDAIVAGGAEVVIAQGPVAPVVHRAVAGRVPVVVAFSGDVVEAGLVESLRRPGKRTTGVSFMVLELVGKRLELLKEIAPSVRRVGIVLNSGHYGFRAELEETLRAAKALGMSSETFDVRTADAFEPAFRAMSRAKLDGIVVFPDALMTRMAPTLSAFAIRERLPVVSGWDEIVRGGALASYGPDLTEAYARVGVQAARILEGADASLIPVERPTHIRIAVNLRTAAAIGVTVPRAVIARADEVIR